MRLAQGRTAVVRSPSFGVRLPPELADYVSPVVTYLARQREPRGELLCYDVFNKTFAFLSGRTIAVDFGQQHAQRVVGDAEIRVALGAMERPDSCSAVIGKKYLRESASEQSLLGRLEWYYVKDARDAAPFCVRET